ncbi:MAG: hypothetical protein SGJ20_22845 [Planctomycetota bacterium]|nr:hypothetical protein [Planctomycetota bacterium]
MPKISLQSLFLFAVVLIGSGAIGYLLLSESNGGPPVLRTREREVDRPQRVNRRLADIPFDGTQAYDYLKAISALGPRWSGSPAMAKQQKMLTDHFEKLGGKVQRQEFKVRHPQTGKPVEMANLVVQWHPEKKERILLCAHYDTRPFPDQDHRNPRGRFIGCQRWSQRRGAVDATW